MVKSVAANARLKDDKGRKDREEAKKNEKKRSLFADILDAQTEEMINAPAQFRTVVYGPNGRVVATQYQTREYV